MRLRQFCFFPEMIVVLFPAPVFLGYPVLYFKLSEKVIASKRDRVKVRNEKYNFESQKIFTLHPHSRC